MAAKKSKSKKPTKPETPADDLPEEPWHIVKVSSIHNRGLFAARDIPKDTKILEYYGEIITKAESIRRSDERLARSKITGEAAVYIFDLNGRYDLDGGATEPNDARYINHSCVPNCEAYQEKNRIFIHAERDIAAGEELLYNYGFDIDHWADHPCHCGAENCVGFIVDRKHWPKLLKILNKQANKVREQKKTAGKKTAGKKTAGKKISTKGAAKKTQR